jgi:hypothetical protein
VCRPWPYTALDQQSAHYVVDDFDKQLKAHHSFQRREANPAAWPPGSNGVSANDRVDIFKDFGGK